MKFWCFFIFVNYLCCIRTGSVLQIWIRIQESQGSMWVRIRNALLCFLKYELVPPPPPRTDPGPGFVLAKNYQNVFGIPLCSTEKYRSQPEKNIYFLKTLNLFVLGAFLAFLCGTIRIQCESKTPYQCIFSNLFFVILCFLLLLLFFLLTTFQVFVLR